MILLILLINQYLTHLRLYGVLLLICYHLVLFYYWRYGLWIDTSQYMVLAPYPQTLRDFGAFNYQLLKDGEVWRLITAAFLHSDLLQIIMSSISILFFVTQL